MTEEDLKCCGNCTNNDVNDGGILQCSDEKNISDYNGSTCPRGYCDNWKSDNQTQEGRKNYIDNGDD